MLLVFSFLVLNDCISAKYSQYSACTNLGMHNKDIVLFVCGPA